MPLKKENSRKSPPKDKQKKALPKSGAVMKTEKTAREMKSKRVNALSTSGKKKKATGGFFG